MPPNAPSGPTWQWRAATRGGQELRREGRGYIEPIFPLPENFQEDSGALLFWELQKSLLTFRDEEAGKFIIKPVFGFWRRALGVGEFHLSVSTPVDYPWESSYTLRRAGLEAGFSTCAPVNELLASVLAHVPYWRPNDSRWRLLEAGRSVWVIDCGSRDLNLGVVHIQRREGRLDFALLAGDCLEGLGGLPAEPQPERVGAAIQKSVPNLIKAAFESPFPGWQGPSPELRRADMIVCAGAGANLAPAREALSARLRALLASPPLARQEVPPIEVVATGAAVHAAILGGQLPYQIGMMRRWIIGLRTQLPDDQTFVGITRPEDEPPFDFERAFKVPGRIENQIEVTLAAALPGGDRFAGLRTFVLKPEQLSTKEDPVLLVTGHLENWAHGEVQVRDAKSGVNLAGGSFRLP